MKLFGRDKRKHQRVENLNVPVKIQIRESFTSDNATLIDLSESGARVEIHHQKIPHLMTLWDIPLKMSAPKLNLNIDCLIDVKRVYSEAEAKSKEKTLNTYGLGMQFKNLDKEIQKQLAQIVQQLAEKQKQLRKK